MDKINTDSIARRIYDLKGKRVEISGIQGSTIDVSKATMLGNKTWGLIEGVCKKFEWNLIGLGSYRANCVKQYYESEGNGKKTKTSSFRSPYDKEPNARHYVDLIPNNKDSSEFNTVQKMNEISEKYANSLINLKDDTQKEAEKEFFRVTPKRKFVFHNELIFQISTEKPLKQLTTKEKKRRSLR